MKPLPPAPQTLEDYIVWKALQMDDGADPMWFALREYSIDADRRDAALMSGLLRMAAQAGCWLRIGAENYEVPVVQVLLKKNPLWPEPWQ